MSQKASSNGMGKGNNEKKPRVMAGFIKLELFFAIQRRFCHSKPNFLSVRLL